jgi:hypothetical protein
MRYQISALLCDARILSCIFVCNFYKMLILLNLRVVRQHRKISHYAFFKTITYKTYAFLTLLSYDIY